MKKLLTALMLPVFALCLAVSLSACAPSSSDNSSASNAQSTSSESASDAKSDDSSHATVSAEDVSAALANPSDYIGDAIELEGAIYAEGDARDGKATWQAYHDPYNLSEPFMFTVDDVFSVKDGEYVRIEGTIVEAVDAPDGEGAPMALIDATNAEVLSAWDGMSSTVPESTVDHDIE